MLSATRQLSSSSSSAAAGGGGAAASNGGPSAQEAQENRNRLEGLVGPQEAHLLRLAEDSKQLTNELHELRFKHCVAEDAVHALDVRICHLDTLISQTAHDRQFLEKHGTLPPPKLAPPQQ